ncbi:MAG: hypothetical protein M1816_002277 [Peltula sp. TS41687]|nr:MAG: hypothetical protein M1816_002277 [Peltula sp. TS41687]
MHLLHFHLSITTLAIALPSIIASPLPPKEWLENARLFMLRGRLSWLEVLFDVPPTGADGECLERCLGQELRFQPFDTRYTIYDKCRGPDFCNVDHSSSSNSPFRPAIEMLALQDQRRGGQSAEVVENEVSDDDGRAGYSGSGGGGSSSSSGRRNTDINHSSSSLTKAVKDRLDAFAQNVNGLAANVQAGVRRVGNSPVPLLLPGAFPNAAAVGFGPVALP